MSVRRRNQWLALANDTVKAPRFRHKSEWYSGRVVSGDNDYTNAYGALPVLMQYAENYQNETGDKVVVLKDRKSNKIKKIPYRTRFSDQYYQKPFDDLRLLKKVGGQYETGMFLTVTGDPSRSFCMKDFYDRMMGGWNKIRTLANKERQDIWDIDESKVLFRDWNGEYVSVVEFQHRETKLPHLHILLLGCTWVDVQRFRELWDKYGIGRIFKVEKIEPRWFQREDGTWYRYTAIDYLLKYMKKMSDNEEHLTELWAINARAYNTSRGLIAEVKRVIFNSQDEDFKLLWRVLDGWEKPDWEYLGAYPTEWMQNIENYDDFMLLILEQTQKTA